MVVSGHKSVAAANKVHENLYPGVDGLVCPQCAWRVQGVEIKQWRADLVRWRVAGYPATIGRGPVVLATICRN